MAHEPSAAEIRAFAQRHSLTEDQARRLFVADDASESRLAHALENLRHFVKAPS